MINYNYIQEHIYSYLKTIPEIYSCTFAVSSHHIMLSDINNLTFHINTALKREFYEDDENFYYKTFLIESSIKSSTITALYDFLYTTNKGIRFRDLPHEYDGFLYAYKAEQ